MFVQCSINLRFQSSSNIIRVLPIIVVALRRSSTRARLVTTALLSLGVGYTHINTTYLIKIIEWNLFQYLHQGHLRRIAPRGLALSAPWLLSKRWGS